MSLIHNKGGLSEQYIDTFIPTLRDNALSGTRMNLSFSFSAHALGMQYLLKFFNENMPDKIPVSVQGNAQAVAAAIELTPEVATHITTIWKNKEFQVHLPSII
jgi:hypothetical protein